VADSLANFGCDSQSDHWVSSTADLPQQIKVYFPRESGLIEYRIGLALLTFILLAVMFLAVL
jgi:hypothetical protein